MSRRKVTSLSAFVQNSGNSGRERWSLRATWAAAVIGGDRVRRWSPGNSSEQLSWSGSCRVRGHRSSGHLCG